MKNIIIPDINNGKKPSNGSYLASLSHIKTAGKIANGLSTDIIVSIANCHAVVNAMYKTVFITLFTFTFLNTHMTKVTWFFGSVNSYSARKHLYTVDVPAECSLPKDPSVLLTVASVYSYLKFTSYFILTTSRWLILYCYAT